MERLDSCYFCGTATDAPLREVSISPRARRGDPDATVRVTLCPSCERKLERVLDGLFDHVESRPVDRDADAEEEPTETVAAEDDPTRSSGGGGVDRIDISADRPAGRKGRRRLFTDPPATAEPPTADGSDGSPDADSDGDDAEIIDDDEPRVRARATAGREDDLAGVSVDEYNRVMRLLQNREFPMARTTFVDLAADAYDIAADTVERVLDAAIDSGALADRDGQLVRPDAEGP